MKLHHVRSFTDVINKMNGIFNDNNKVPEYGTCWIKTINLTPPPKKKITEILVVPSLIGAKLPAVMLREWKHFNSR